MPSVQESIKERVVSDLRKKLNTELTIEKLHIQPFNTVELNGVHLLDRENNQILKAEKIYGSIQLLPLIKKNVVITAIRLNDFDITLSKDSSSAPLNIQFVIDAFKPDNKENKMSFDVRINSVILNNGNFSFDIKDKPVKEDLAFDKNHIRVSDFNASLALKSIEKDSLNIQIKRLNLKEKSGVQIKNLIARVISHDNRFQVKGFRLELPSSLLAFTKCEADLSGLYLGKDSLNRISFDCNIQSSYITPKDVSAFTKTLRNFEDRIYFSTHISGLLDDFKVTNLKLDYGNKMNLVANASVRNVLNGDSLYLIGKLDRLTFSPDGVESLLNNFSVDKKSIPKQVRNLGNTSFSGDVKGFLKNLKANGLLQTGRGVVRTDMFIGINPRKDIESSIKGKIYTNDFEIGNLADNKDLDKLSFDLLIDLEKRIGRKMTGDVKGHVSRLDYKQYSYKNIDVNGKYNGMRIEGEALIDDENVFLDINGIFDLSKEKPELDFNARLKNFQPGKLNLSEKYKNSYLSLNVDANFSGKTIDDMQGYLSVDSISFYRDGTHLFLDKFYVEAGGVSPDRMLIVKSDIINGEVRGEYSFTTIAASLKRTFNGYLPSVVNIENPEKLKVKDSDLTLNFTVKNTSVLSQVLSLPFVVYSDAKIIGFYNNLFDRFRLEVFYPSGKVGGMNMKSGYFLAESSDGKMMSTVSGIVDGKGNVKNDINVDIVVGNDSIDAKLKFTNDSKKKFRGTFHALTNFSRNEETKSLDTRIDLAYSDVVISDTLWHIDNSSILLSKDLLSVNDLNIYNSFRSQSITIDGKYSDKNPEDVLKINLKNIDLEYVFNTLAIDALNFSGYATGTVSCSSVENKPYLNVDLGVNNFGFNNTKLGTLNLHSKLDEETNHILLTGVLLDEQQKKTDIDGYIDPVTQRLSIDFDSEQVDIAFLNKYASTLFNDIKGKGNGKVKLYGDFSNVTVTGKAYIDNGSLGINFLNTRYSFSDTIYLKEDLIYFNNVTFHDQMKNEAKISGKVSHDFFTNFLYYVELSGKKFMLYNATEAQNSLFFGKVFASGIGSINGDERSVMINAQLKTEADTKVRMNFMEETVNTYSFITYKEDPSQQDSVSENGERKHLRKFETDSDMEINMNFYVDATPDATVELVMDPVGGDILRGAGSGALQFVWGTKTDPKLYGTYVINNGSYNFTFQKIVERKFQIDNGGSILFRGDPFQANLNVSAIYKLNANLYDLDATLVETTGQTSVPVECILNMTGELQHPNIGLDVALPSADPEVQRQVKSLMNNEDMISRQMVYLLLLSKFYTPNYANPDHRSSDWASLASATLSTQLTKVLSNIDDRWQFGSNIRTGDATNSYTEVELLLSSQLLNNRVLLNGNFGYRDDPQTKEAFISDVDVEVLLNPSGTWRLKAYNHYNEKYFFIGEKGIQTQGIGLIYRKNFDYFRDFLGLKPKLKSTVVQDSVQPVLPDSTVKGSSLGDFIKIK
ncbi:MAG: translocation/assembly module TamB domain-containing protein [Dysgonomonas sp.]